ncbi:MAG: SRPBCC domain-containing protein [Ardenticatenaceae bacterium]|nr:SRPBCC domain-containing protein [Ardenticatenaceae bacterium]
MSESLTFTQAIQASCEAVYYALTNAAALTEWFCDDARINLQENGRLHVWWRNHYYVTGEFTRLVPNEALAFTWFGRGEPGVTQVAIELAGENGRTQVQVTHTGFGQGEAWDAALPGYKKGWESGLANLKSVLETGLDKRVYDVPFIGILPTAQLTAEQMAELGSDAVGGIRIGGAVGGTGAAAAGLQEEDVLVSLAGTPIPTFQDIGKAVSAHKAGDEIAVVLVRDGVTQTAHMKLSQRPAPNVPDTAVAYAETVRELYDQLRTELDDLLADVTEEEAAHVLDEDGWNVKEVLAHLVQSERNLQLSLALQISDQPAAGFPNNPPAWTKAVTAVYPTLGDMVALWQRTLAETVALVAHFPNTLIQRKATYLNTGTTLLLGFPSHTRTHFRQIREAIQAARQA